MSEKDDRGPGRADRCPAGEGLGEGPPDRAVDRVRKATYEWHESIDGKHWTSVEPTRDAVTTISGLTAGTRYSVQLRAEGAEGLGDWRRVISVLVS
jgi:hypothetical protein